MSQHPQIAIVLISSQSLPMAHTLLHELPGATLFSKESHPHVVPINSYGVFFAEAKERFDVFIFIGALGICVRTIAPHIKSKVTDPAVINIDSTGRYVIPVLSGHVGGANHWASVVAGIVGGEAIVTTQSDNMGLWPLDLLATQNGWGCTATKAQIDQAIFLFVRKEKTALLLEVRDRGTDRLEETLPQHVSVFYRREDFSPSEFALVLVVSPWSHRFDVPSLQFIPSVLHLGLGCQRGCAVEGVAEEIGAYLSSQGLSPQAIASVSTIELKKDEPLLSAVQTAFEGSKKHIFQASELEPYKVPNPSEQVQTVTGVSGVSEGAALAASKGGRLLIEKQKRKQAEGLHYTYAVSLDRDADRLHGHIEIVGAGPGDPELVSVRGKNFLQRADLILYAGSLVPKELTYYAKPGATVRNSAQMNLDEQFALMKEFYDRGCLVVRLHTGDPSIYGAIAEQMAFMDHYNMSYHITPGISSFLAAAAALRSQFTIPEEVQTIILTRGEGRTAMPEKEKLSLLARSQSTMCIFLSATLVDEVQAELLKEYPPHTPVAVCHKLTWKEEAIYRGQLSQLAQLVKENNLSLTTLLVVGKAIDNREGTSKLYDPNFKHIFRP